MKIVYTINNREELAAAFRQHQVKFEPVLNQIRSENIDTTLRKDRLTSEFTNSVLDGTNEAYVDRTLNVFKISDVQNIFLDSPLIAVKTSVKHINDVLTLLDLPGKARQLERDEKSTPLNFINNYTEYKENEIFIDDKGNAACSKDYLYIDSAEANFLAEELAKLIENKDVILFETFKEMVNINELLCLLTAEPRLASVVGLKVFMLSYWALQESGVFKLFISKVSSLVIQNSSTSFKLAHNLYKYRYSLSGLASVGIVSYYFPKDKNALNSLSVFTSTNFKNLLDIGLEIGSNTGNYFGQIKAAMILGYAKGTVSGLKISFYSFLGFKLQKN
jgi:hypothetical protein